jgi:hypothetical protein
MSVIKINPHLEPAGLLPHERREFVRGGQRRLKFRHCERLRLMTGRPVIRERAAQLDWDP